MPMTGRADADDRPGEVNSTGSPSPQDRLHDAVTDADPATATGTVFCMSQPIPFPPGAPFTTAQARRAGLSDRALLELVAHGRLVKMRHGWFQAPAPSTTSRNDAARRARIALHEGPACAVASHQTAAALHGLPLVRASTSRVHLTANRPAGGRRTGHVHLHTSRPGSLDVAMIGDIPVTSIARTITDLSRSAGFESGVCAADSALRKKLLTRRELELEVAQHRGLTGAAIARDVLDFAVPDSESAGESLSRCLMRTMSGIPAPRLQHELFTPDGTFVARTDFSWGDGALVGEFDGKVKYTRNAEYGFADDPGDVVWKEKQREDRIRALGIIVIRWVWADLYKPELLRRRILGGLRLAGVY